MHCCYAEANRFRNSRSGQRGRTTTYYVTTRTPASLIEGKLPLTAAEVLAYVKRAEGLPVEIRDAQQRAVNLEVLRQEASFGCWRMHRPAFAQITHSGPALRKDMTRNEALHDIIDRLRRENISLAIDLERLSRPRSTKDLREIDRIRNRIAVNADVIRECEAQLASKQP